MFNFFKKNTITKKTSKPTSTKINTSEEYDEYELPWGWHSKNKKWLDGFHIKEQKLVDYAIKSQQLKGQEKIDILNEMIKYYNSMRKECYSKSENHKKYFGGMWEHCQNTTNEDFEYIKPYEDELNEIEKNLNEYMELCKMEDGYCTTYEILLKIRLLKFINSNQGILQKDIYKAFENDYSNLIKSSLNIMDKRGQIKRIKHGNTYELYTSTQ